MGIMTKFQKRHYELIAEAIKRAIDTHHVSIETAHILDKLSNLFASDNPEFDRERFITACGL